MIYTLTDLERSTNELFSGMRNVIEEGVHVVRPSVYVFSYARGQDGKTNRMLGRMKRPLPLIKKAGDFAKVVERVQTFVVLGMGKKKVTTEAILLAVEGPRDLLPMGSRMGRSKRVAAVYLDHIHRPSQVVYAPVSRSGDSSRVGEYSEIEVVSLGDCPQLLPIEVYGRIAGEA